MKGRILFTGSGKLILEDLMAHMPPTYQKKSCAPTERLFVNMINEFNPHVIVACVHQCVPGRLQMYDTLEGADYEDIPMIVIGNKEDCNLFCSHVSHKEMKIMVRPVEYDDFQKVLDEYLSESMEKEEKEIIKNSDEEVKKRNQQRLAEKRKDQESMIPGNEAVDVRKSILVVDDDVRMLNLMKLYLQDTYEVTVVPSGKLALKFLSKKHADLVLLDYMMPEMDGPEVLRHIREESSSPDIPVVFLTGVSDKEKVLRGLNYNPTAYVLKPVARNELRERVKVLLGLS